MQKKRSPRLLIISIRCTRGKYPRYEAGGGRVDGGRAVAGYSGVFFALDWGNDRPRLQDIHDQGRFGRGGIDEGQKDLNSALYR